jgi:hypothetical protein
LKGNIHLTDKIAGMDLTKLPRSPIREINVQGGGCLDGPISRGMFIAKLRYLIEARGKLDDFSFPETFLEKIHAPLGFFYDDDSY